MRRILTDRYQGADPTDEAAAMNDVLLHRELTDLIIKAFYRVYNTLGYGFLERVYENALAHELRTLGLKVQQQVPINVHYQGVRVGEYFGDLLVEDKVLLELKSCEELCDKHATQLLNYLNASPIEVGLLFHFGEKPTIKRKIQTNDRKKSLSSS
ncbi:MAG: GxxExxY protein [Pirellulales bacterium]